MNAHRIFPLLFALSALAGCSSEADPTGGASPSCPEGNEVAGACAGVPQGSICSDDYCAAGLTCSSVLKAADDAAVAAAVAGAAAGSCVALAPGSYSDISLPGGVSLLGKGAGDVTVKSVVLGSGAEGAVLRGITVAGGGVVIQSVGSQIVSSHIDGSAGAGVTVAAGASVKIVQSEITASTTYGVSAFDASSVSLEGTIISGSKGPGVWVQCAGGCDCAAQPSVSIGSSIVRDNKIVGVSLVGVSATVTSSDVRDNSEGNNFQASGGVSVAGCSALIASSLRVLDNSSFGVLVDHSSATIGGLPGDQGVEVSRNFMGVWVQNVTNEQGVKLDGLTIDHNQAVGLGASGGSRGIICWNSAITGTQSAVIPVLAGGAPASQEVGDGIAWLDGSELQLDKLMLSGNGRASVLINGDTASGSSIGQMTLSGGDEARGVVQQNVSGSPQSPSVGAGAPSITTSTTEKFSVPVAPAVPAGK